MRPSIKHFFFFFFPEVKLSHLQYVRIVGDVSPALLNQKGKCQDLVTKRKDQRTLGSEGVAWVQQNLRKAWAWNTDVMRTTFSVVTVIVFVAELMHEFCSYS